MSSQVPLSAHHDVIIVGAGHAGTQAAIALRQQKFEGSIALLSDEPAYPYERPPLSKEYLAGEKPFERIMIRPAAFWSEREIDLRLNTEVQSVDADAHTVSLNTGDTLHYGQLIWAAGGAPRTLSCLGRELKGIYYVRSKADCDAIMSRLPDCEAVTIIGGGYIGLEMAAVLRGMGKQVTLLEALDRVLSRVAGPELSDFFEAEHRRQGVDLRVNCAVSKILGAQERVNGVELAGGEIIASDMVVAGIGIVPSVEPLLEAGAKGTNGIKVDAQCRTSLPDIFAIGDCAAHANQFAGGDVIRVESVQNANDQASTVAKVVTGQNVRYEASPWFWSNQYDIRLQTVGISTGYDEAIIRGDPSARSFSVIYMKEGTVVALDCVNAVKDYAQGRNLVTKRIQISDLTDICNHAVPLKEIIARARVSDGVSVR